MLESVGDQGTLSAGAGGRAGADVRDVDAASGFERGDECACWEISIVARGWPSPRSMSCSRASRRKRWGRTPARRRRRPVNSSPLTGSSRVQAGDGWPTLWSSFHSASVGQNDSASRTARSGSSGAALSDGPCQRSLPLRCGAREKPPLAGKVAEHRPAIGCGARRVWLLSGLSRRRLVRAERRPEVRSPPPGGVARSAGAGTCSGSRWP
jgi:hypothetical protein